MNLPAIIVNFKTYTHVDGEKALELARICQEVHDETGASIIISPPMVELSALSKEVDIPVYAQNADHWGGEVQTGSTRVSEISGAGAMGLIINHSECRRTLADIDGLIKAARKEGLTTIVCTNNSDVSAAAALLGPDFVAMEPPELIGGDISVTTADPDIVSETVEKVGKVAPNVKVLTGAGVKTGKDVRIALELGTHGVLLASGVVKAEDPKAVLLELVKGLKK